MAPTTQRPTAIAQAIAQFRAGEIEEAAASCRSILDQQPDQPVILELLGLIEGMHGDPRAARVLLERASELRPDRPELLNNLAIACRRSGDADAAVSYLRRALRHHPTFADGWYTLAITLSEGGDYQGALDCYERVTSLAPEQADAWANLAQIREQLNQPEAAGAAARRALQIDPANVMATLVLAQIDGRRGDAQAARERLSALLERDGLSRNHEIVARRLLGAAFDQLDDTEAAFEQYSVANRLQARDYHTAYQISEGPYALPAIRRIADHLEAGHFDAAPPDPSDPAGAAPIFLLGFPRSGTTLLDRMLSAHPQLTTLEERETLIDLHRDFVLAPGGLERLCGLDDAGLAFYRQAYRRRVIDILEVPPETLLIDKLPLNTIFLPLIARVFPAVRIVFVLRDPRDVCLSSFMQNFQLNAAMAHFLDLELTAEYYRAVMTLGLDSLERCAIRHHRVRYESLIEDPEATLRGLTTFLGVPWRPEMLDYRRSLAGARIETPSYGQVARPLYRSSIGRWRRYASQLQPLMGTLEPLIERLGY
jgi:tetratricopeptide (TPR) repeat protein